MCLRPLKNYEKYLGQIELYAKAVGIKIEYKEEQEDGAYIPTLRKIRLDPGMSPARDIAVLLHELGHSLDDHLVNKTSGDAVCAAYTAMYNKRCTPNQRRVVLSCERRAWKYAEVVARKLRIPLGVWFYIVKDECLKSYRKH